MAVYDSLLSYLSIQKAFLLLAEVFLLMNKLMVSKALDDPVISIPLIFALGLFILRFSVLYQVFLLFLFILCFGLYIIQSI